MSFLFPSCLNLSIKPSYLEHVMVFRTEDAYSSGHLVLSHLGLAFVLMLRPFFPELVMSTDLLSFEHPSVLLFCFRNQKSCFKQVITKCCYVRNGRYFCGNWNHHDCHIVRCSSGGYRREIGMRQICRSPMSLWSLVHEDRFQTFNHPDTGTNEISSGALVTFPNINYVLIIFAPR